MPINSPDTNAVPKTWNVPPAMQIDAAKKYTAVFDTSLGSFKVELLAGESPKTVNNFVFLARKNSMTAPFFTASSRPS